jgi:hypothetical protein
MALMSRRIMLLVVLLLGLVAVRPAPVAAFSSFGAMTADATYGKEMTFSVALDGGAPERLDILLDFGGSDATFVAPVTPQGATATYRWDAAESYVTPNTRISYRWRATTGSEVRLSPEGTLLYADDRPGLDWRSARIGQAVVHWYGNAESRARHFGDLTADAVQRAEALLGHDLSGPLDIFVYASNDAFFGALGPGAREWTGAATYPEIRTVFMNLEKNSASYLDTVVTHEVTHVVFHDATDNPFHEPARWLNEGIATWAEQQNANQEQATVRADAHDGLFAFDAITQQFPIGDRGALLSYAQGATMVDLIIKRFGPAAIARLTAAYRDGATDAQALQAATGESADELYADYFESYGAEQPQPVKPDPLPPSTVAKAGQHVAPGSSAAVPPPEPPDASPTDSRDTATAGQWLVLVPLLLLGGLGLAAAFVIRRRSGARNRDRGGGIG